MKNILPMGTSILQSYPYYVHAISAIDSHTKDYIPWILDHFVQLVVPNDLSKGCRIDYAAPDIMRGNPWIENGRIDKEIVYRKWGRITDFFKECIDQQCYIYTLHDVSKIKAYEANNKELFQAHDPIIYGYDDENQVFYLGDFFCVNGYSYGTATYEEVETAVRSFYESDTIDWLTGILYYRYRTVFDYGTYRFDSSYQYTFQLDLFLSLLNDFLNGLPSLQKWNYPFLLEDDRKFQNIWGVHVFDYYLNYLQDVKKNHDGVDVRGIYVIREHTELLLKTLEYLEKEKNILKNQDLINKLLKNEKLATNVLHLMIKYMITNNLNVIDEIIFDMQQLKEQELVAVNQMYSFLKNLPR